MPKYPHGGEHGDKIKNGKADLTFGYDVYEYKGRPDARYKKSGKKWNYDTNKWETQWLINLGEKTNDKYVPVRPNWFKN